MDELVRCLPPGDQATFIGNLECEVWRFEPLFQRSISYSVLRRLLRFYCEEGVKSASAGASDKGSEPPPLVRMRDIPHLRRLHEEGKRRPTRISECSAGAGDDEGTSVLREQALPVLEIDDYAPVPPTCALTYAWDTPIEEISCALDRWAGSSPFDVSSLMFFVDIFSLDQTSLDFSQNLVLMARLYASVEQHLVVYHAAFEHSEWTMYEVAIRVLAGRTFHVESVSKGLQGGGGVDTDRLRLTDERKQFLLMQLPVHVMPVDLDLLVKHIAVYIEAALG